MNQCCLIIAFILFLSSSFSLCSIVFKDNRLYDGSPCQLPDGTNGICKTNCSSINDPRNATLCGFKRNIAIICCPNPVTRYPNIEKVCARRKQTLQEKKARRLEVEEAQRQMDLLVQAHEKRCLQRVKNLTGVLRERTLRVCLFEITVTESPYAVPQLFPAELHDPHVVALGLTRPDGSMLWYCSGTFIHESFILTAAHCLANIGMPQAVRISDTDLNSPAGDELAEDYIVVTSYVSPDYKPPKYYNDIGLVRIHRRPSFEPVARLPACIWTEHDFPENELLMMGYGAPVFSLSHNGKLYQGNLILMNSDKCTKSYESYDTLPDGIISSQICAKYDPSGLIDTCEGDSGGPMQFHSNDEFKTPYLVGITSFGVLCLDGNPGVYTRIHSYLSWIENIIGT